MKKTQRLVIREDVRLKRTIDVLALKMEITSTDFIRMVVRNGAKFYAKKFNIPYLAAVDISYAVIESSMKKSSSSDDEPFIDEKELKILEEKTKKLK
jgi:hypothetical protein